MTELKPCPFCGGEARMYTTESRQSYRRAVVKCKSCGAELRKEGGGYPDFPGVEDAYEKRRLSNERAKQRAAEAWNTRAVAVDMAELKPCPFCGGEAHIHQAEDGAWHIDTYCGADKPPYHCAYVIADTKAEAVKAWNTRAVTVDVERFCEVSGL